MLHDKRSPWHFSRFSAMAISIVEKIRSSVRPSSQWELSYKRKMFPIEKENPVSYSNKLITCHTNDRFGIILDCDIYFIEINTMNKSSGVIK